MPSGTPSNGRPAAFDSPSLMKRTPLKRPPSLDPEGYPAAASTSSTDESREDCVVGDEDGRAGAGRVAVHSADTVGSQITVPPLPVPRVQGFSFRDKICPIPVYQGAAPDQDFDSAVRKTVNDLEQSLERREQENLNLKLLVRQLQEERSGGHDASFNANLLETAERESRQFHHDPGQNQGLEVAETGSDSEESCALRATSSSQSVQQQPGRTSLRVTAHVPRPHVPGQLPSLSPIKPVRGSLAARKANRSFSPLDHTVDPDFLDPDGGVYSIVESGLARKSLSPPDERATAGGHFEDMRGLLSELNSKQVALIKLSSKLVHAESSSHEARTSLHQAELRLKQQQMELCSQLQEAQDEARGLEQQLKETFDAYQANQTLWKQQETRIRDLDEQIHEMKAELARVEAKELEREAEKERERNVERQRVAESQHSQQSKIEELTAQGADYRANIVKYEACVAELRAELESKTEGMAAQASRLSQQQAMIESLESELKQQQNWDSLGSPSKTIRSERSSPEKNASSGSDKSVQHDNAGRVRDAGNPLTVISKTSTSCVELTPSELVFIEPKLSAAQAEKDHFASILANQEHLSRTTAKELKSRQNLDLASAFNSMVTDHTTVFAADDGMRSALATNCDPSGQSNDQGPDRSVGGHGLCASSQDALITGMQTPCDDSMSLKKYVLESSRSPSPDIQFQACTTDCDHRVTSPPPTVEEQLRPVKERTSDVLQPRSGPSQPPLMPEAMQKDALNERISRVEATLTRVSTLTQSPQYDRLHAKQTAIELELQQLKGQLHQMQICHPNSVEQATRKDLAPASSLAQFMTGPESIALPHRIPAETWSKDFHAENSPGLPFSAKTNEISSEAASPALAASMQREAQLHWRIFELEFDKNGPISAAESLMREPMTTKLSPTRPAVPTPRRPAAPQPQLRWTGIDGMVQDGSDSGDKAAFADVETLLKNVSDLVNSSPLLPLRSKGIYTERSPLKPFRYSPSPPIAGQGLQPEIEGVKDAEKELPREGWMTDTSTRRVAEDYLVGKEGPTGIETRGTQAGECKNFRRPHFQTYGHHDVRNAMPDGVHTSSLPSLPPQPSKCPSAYTDLSSLKEASFHAMQASAHARAFNSSLSLTPHWTASTASGGTPHSAPVQTLPDHARLDACGTEVTQADRPDAVLAKWRQRGWQGEDSLRSALRQWDERGKQFSQGRSGR